MGASEVEKDMEFNSAWMDEFCHAMADPSNRITAKQFAIDHNISEQNLYKWKSRHREQVMSRIETLRKQYRTDIRSKAWKALAGQLEKGDTPAIKLAFQMIGDFVEKSEASINYMTPEDKKARIAAMLDKVLADKKKKSTGAEAE